MHLVLPELTNKLINSQEKMTGLSDLICLYLLQFSNKYPHVVLHRSG